MILLLDHVMQIRQDYIDDVPIADIIRKHGINQQTLYDCADGVVRGSQTRLPALPRRRLFRLLRHKARIAGSQEARRNLIGQLWRTASRQVREIEDRLARGGIEPSERERDARLLATLVKTLRELSTLDPPEPVAPAGADAQDDDPVPRDIDEFRRELARRIEAFVASRRDGGVSRDPD